MAGEYLTDEEWKNGLPEGATPQEQADYWERAANTAELVGDKKHAAEYRDKVDRVRSNDTYGEWDTLQSQFDPFKSRTPEEQAAFDKAIGNVDPNALHYYGVGDKRGVSDAERVAVDKLRSNWRGQGSAWQGDQSAYRGLGYDPRQSKAMGEAAGYYGDLMRNGGRDAQSEAEYGRRIADAEQIRRAQTEAALAAEEARGGGSAGSRVLAEQAASQAQVGDAYGAGLDANALAQARRDNAASQYFGLSKGLGDTLWNAGTQRAAGLDAFTQSSNAGLDAFQQNKLNALDYTAQQNASNRFAADAYNADKESNAANMNWDRSNYVNDANADTWNAAYSGNAANQGAATGTYMSALTGADATRFGQGSLDLGKRSQDLAEDRWKFEKANADTKGERTRDRVIGTVYGGLQSVKRSGSPV